MRRARTEPQAPGQVRTCKNGQEIIVQVARDEKDHKGAMLTTYISLPGRYVVLMPNRQSTGISRKIDDDESRKSLMELMEQISAEERVGFIVRTAGMNRTKQELSRDYYVLLQALARDREQGQGSLMRRP